MKKVFLSNAIILFIILTLFSSISFAEDDLNIGRWIVDAKLLKNGDLQVSEDITFNFNDDFNGVYRNIVLDKIDGIEDLSIFEIVKGQEIVYQQVEKAKKGDKNKFTSKIDKKDLELQIYSPSNDETKTFRLNYLLKNVAVRHSDTGEFYYKFLGQENETPIDYFTVNLHLPKFEKEKIKIFAHGPQQGKVYFSDEKIKSEIKDIEAGELIENRILFPKDYILFSKKKGDKTFKQITEEERIFAEQIEKQIEAKAVRKELFSKISLYSSFLALLIAALLFYKFRRDTSVFEDMESTYPDEITPAELSLFMNKVVSNRSFLASLLDLSHKGYIDITEIDGKKDSKEYIFKRTQKPMDHLKDHEVFILDWIFNDITGHDEVDTLDIEEYRKKNSTKFYGSQTKWNKLIKADLLTHNYYDSSAKAWGAAVMILSIVWFILGIITLSMETLYGLIPLFIGIGIFIYGASLMYRTSNKGYIQLKLWKDFKDSMLNKNKKNIDIDDDKALIYAIGLDVPMKGLNSFRTSIDEDYYPLNWGYLFFLTNKKGGSQFEDKFTNRFYGYAGSSTSTSSNFGGGGGFSGGGGGGAGGGGAGGF